MRYCQHPRATAAHHTRHIKKRARQELMTVSISALLPIALVRYCDGEIPTARLNVRVKWLRSAKPAEVARSVKEVSDLASCLQA